MADFYLDISAVGNEYQAYSATPTWGALSTDKPLPMDGSGLAGPGHSAAVAIAEIQITVLPGDTNTLVIAGATLTAKTTAAAKNQWTIGASIATCVTNLRDLINTFGTGTAQCDAAVSTSACKLTLALSYWQFARVKPGTTDTLQIATRIAGADLNQASNSAVTISSSGWATPPTITQFAGGANGPFAYILNTTTVFGKADNQAGTTAPSYGILFNAAPGPSEPGLSDVVKCRTRRSGVDLSAPTWTATGSAVSGTYIARYYLFDNGSTWSGDNGKFTLTFKRNSANAQLTTWSLPSGSQLGFCAAQRGNFEIQFGLLSGTGSITLFSTASTNSGVLAQNCRFVETADHITACALNILSPNTSPSNVHFDLSGSFVQFRSVLTNKLLMNSSGSSTQFQARFNGLDVEVLSATGALGTLISNTAGTGFCNYEWIGGSVNDSLGVYSCQNPFSVVVGSASEITIDSVRGITDPSVAWTASNTVNASLRWNQPEGPNRGFRYQTPRFSIDWKSDGTFPYAATAADLRGNGWSHRVTWTATPQVYGSVTVLRLAHFYRSSAATKTITLPLYVPDATTMYVDEFDFEVTYLDSTDVIRTERAIAPRANQWSSSRTALPTGDSAWTSSGVASHSAKQISITTAYSVKQNSEITARLSLAKNRAVSVVFYASPELVLT